MEIKNTYLRQAEPYSTNINKARNEAVRRGAEGQTDQSGSIGDRASLSPEAILRAEAHRVANASPDLRQEKIEAIKQSIADGTYSIDSRDIAARLLQSDAMLADTLAE